MDKINSSVWEKNTYQTNYHLNEVLSFQVLEVGIAEGHLENGNIWAHQQHWCTWALFRNPPGAHLLVFLLIETPIWFGLASVLLHSPTPRMLLIHMPLLV